MKRKLDFVLRSKDASVVFEDTSIIAINKPPNLLVLPDRYNQSIPNLYHILKEELGEIFVVHRIDKETSGIIVFAKNAMAHGALNDQFESRKVKKSYRAIAVGTAGEREGRIDAPISEGGNHSRTMSRKTGSRFAGRIDMKRGKTSVTNYKVIDAFDGYAFVAAEPETGRMHQIRIHLASIGMPIMCDSIYGDGKPFFLSRVKTRYFSEGEEKPLLSRTALHAESISFSHPETNEPISLTAEMPKDMRSVLNYLRKFKPITSMADGFQSDNQRRSASANG